jgi:hypothetical protein
MECAKRPEGQEPRRLPIPAAILEQVDHWKQFGNQGYGGLSITEIPHFDRTELAWAEVREAADYEYRLHEQRNDTVGMSLWARATEKTRKLALIYACSSSLEPVITSDAVRWASDLVFHSTRKMLYMFRKNSSDGEFDQKSKKLIEFLEGWRKEKGPESWVPLWAITRNCRWSQRDHKEIRDTLIEQRIVEIAIVKQKSGRPSTCYRLL